MKFSWLMPLAVVCVGCGGAEPDSSDSHASVAQALRSAAFISNPRVVYADGLHNENTELHRTPDGRLLLAFRGGETAQTRSPRAYIHILQSRDNGRSFTPLSRVAMPNDPSTSDDDRDIRDPKLVTRGETLMLYAISRRPSPGVRDLGGLAWTVRSESRDGGRTFSTPAKTFEDKSSAGDETHWGFWRFSAWPPGFSRGGLFATGYDDGDTKVGLFFSADGRRFVKTGLVLDSYDDIPSEAELQFLGPHGDTAVALVRLDNQSYLDNGQTAVCTKRFPFVGAFECGRRLEQRFDGPTWFPWTDARGRTRHFVFARKSLSCTRKRTAVYEVRGDLASPGAPLSVCEAAELPSRGDTAYTAIAPKSTPGQFLLTWYSSRLDSDLPWLSAQFAPSDIWAADVDFTRYDPASCVPPEPDPVCPPPPVPAGARADVSGTHLLSLAPVVWPAVGVFFEATFQVEPDALVATLQPLDQSALAATGARVPVGQPIGARGPLSPDGRFTLDFGFVRLPVAAYPLLGADPPLAIVLSGQTRSADEACGAAFGRVIFGAGANDYIDLTGTTFGSVRVFSGVPAAPVTSCR